jgi:hypothetical protein
MAAQDHEVRGQKVRKGDKVILCFPSGNRDDEIFTDPFEFQVDRKPNRQIAFGCGAHMCLGMHLARMEMSIFFQELLPRLQRVELAGKPQRTITNFVGSPKSVSACEADKSGTSDRSVKIFCRRGARRQARCPCAWPRIRLNRPGASGTIAPEGIANAPPIGYSSKIL